MSKKIKTINGMEIHKRKKHYTPGEIVWEIIKYFSLIFFSLCAIVPIFSCLVTALKTKAEYESTSVMVMPKNWLNFDNFVQAFKRANLLVAFRNSALVVVVVVVGSVIVGTMLAYVLNRFKFPGNGFIRGLFTIAALFPGIAMQVSTYEIMGKLHLINTLPGYMIMMMGTDVISIYLFIQFFENISVSLDESAILDGASYFKIYSKILLPVMKPAIVTCVILKGTNTYNEYYNANLYLQDKNKLCTVSTALYKFVGPMGSQYNLICASVIISLIPALIIFILCQKQIYQGIAAGAVKG